MEIVHLTTKTPGPDVPMADWRYPADFAVACGQVMGQTTIHTPDPTKVTCGRCIRSLTMEERQVPTEEREEPSNENVIVGFIHCALCLTGGIPADESARSWARLEMGWTVKGFQVWCLRHDVNVVHVDFEGAKHVANTTRKEKG